MYIFKEFRKHKKYFSIYLQKAQSIRNIGKLNTKEEIHKLYHLYKHTFKYFYFCHC